MDGWFIIPRQLSLWGREERMLFLLLLTEAGEDGIAKVSLRELAGTLGMSRRKLGNALEKLEANHLVNHLVDHLGTSVSICGYDRYKGSRTAPGPPTEPPTEPVKESPLSPPTPPIIPKEIYKETLSKERSKKETSSEKPAEKTIPPPPSLEDRQREFYNSLVPYIKQYPGEMLREFYDYWSEPDRAKAPKMRWEKQTTWSLGGRLARWSRNRKPEQSKPSKLDQYKQVAIQLGIYHGTEQSDTVDEQ